MLQPDCAVHASSWTVRWAVLGASCSHVQTTRQGPSLLVPAMQRQARLPLSAQAGWLTLAVLSTAPRPVVTPQPSRQTLPMSARLSILATLTSCTTVYSEKVDVPICKGHTAQPGYRVQALSQRMPCCVLTGCLRTQMLVLRCSERRRKGAQSGRSPCQTPCAGSAACCRQP